MKKIALIGGAGPEAGALLFKNVITFYQSKGAWHDHDFPQIMLLNIPFSPMLESNSNRIAIEHELQMAVDIAYSAQTDIVAIACNTLHSFVSAINFKNMEFIHIVHVVMDAVKAKKSKKLLFLGTKTSVHAKIYEQSDIHIIYPSPVQQDAINQCIIRILKNNYSSQDSVYLSTVINECAQHNDFDGVILGCTELSIVHHQWQVKPSPELPIFDPIYILAHRLHISEINGKSQ